MLRRPHGLPLGALFLSAAFLFTGCNRDPQVQKQKYYSKGLDYLKKDKINDAKLQFLNALKIDPNFAEAASILAEIQFREKNYKQAYTLLQQAVHSKPDLMPPHKGLAQFYKLTGKFADAQKELEIVLERTPDEIDTLMNLGTIQELQHKSKDAQGTFSRIMELQPNHVGALLALASVSRDTNDLDGAERYLKLALEKNPRSVPVYLALFKFYITTKQAAKMEPLFPQANQDTNNNIQLLEAEDGFFEGANRLTDAEAVVRKIQSGHASEQPFWSAMADFYVRTNNWPHAKSELERVIQQHKDDVDDLHKLIEVLLNMNNRKDAEALNDGLLKKNGKDSYAHLFRGRIALSDGKVDAADQEFNETQKFRPDWPALHFWKAQSAIHRGQLEQAKSELETALTYDPDNRPARLTLAAVQRRTGAIDVAMANSVRLLRNNLLDVPALLIYSECLIAKKDYDRASKALKIAADNSPQNPDIHRQLGVLFLAQKNAAAARKEFQLAWSMQPESKQLMENVVLGYVVDGQITGAVDLLKQAIASRPNDAVLRVELARMYLWHGQKPDAISALQSAMKLAPTDPDSDILLAEVYAADNNGDQALALLAPAMHKAGVDTAGLLHIGMVFERLHQWNEARDAYERALQFDASNALAKNNLASVLSDHGGDLNVALTLAQQAKEKMVDSLEVTNTLGWIYYKRELYAMALKYLEFCAAKDQRNATFQYELGMTHWKLGHSTEARRFLVKALELDAHFPEAGAAATALSQIGPG
jgi:tetratricopeptide (TPR) repeat protein